ncbi:MULTISPECIES: hypothetical protein [unclassified Caballeronia]|uniref:hypothetical protein n=1 Tax=unclassified Caballeronia TaxID=2646786 RepID=UPI0028585EC0|nr:MULTISPECIES: hypothetical protein [unclassified Caballeronia]MDR5754995.1 hypothetical protein [Caballeronia sp. LZ024]MDR5845554.1 hypothetical protein [Caballeronia sp. LZ031]
MSTLAGMPISRDPLALANLYNAGLGRNWKNQREAVAAMARFTPKVTREALNRAVAVAKLPAEVISLFDVAGLWPETARSLVELLRKYGPTKLQDRATAVDRTGKSWNEIVDLLDGREPVPPKRPAKIPPLALAAEYQRGLAKGSWTSLRAALDARKDWKAFRLSQAIAISNLPPEVLELFKSRPLTYRLGVTLVQLQKAIGTEELAARATEMLGVPRRRSTDQIVAALLKVRLKGEGNVRVRREGSDMVFEFKVPLSEPDQLVFTAEEMAALIEMSIMTLKVKMPDAKRKTKKKPV